MQRAIRFIDALNDRIGRAVMWLALLIVPFVIIQIFALALLWFAPGMATWLPSVLYPG